MWGWIRYWWAVLCRAWQETWEMVIPHSWKTLLLKGIYLIFALALLYLWQGDLVARRLTSTNNLQDTIVWLVFAAMAMIALFAVVFIVEALFIVPYRMWRELVSQIDWASTDHPSDLMRKYQSGDWVIKYPPKNDGPNWSLRELFCYIDPSLSENHDPLAARDVGQDVIDKLAIKQLRAWGKPDGVGSGKRRPLTEIPSDFWQSAEWIYWFLDGEDHRDLVHAKGPFLSADKDSAYRDIQVNKLEAIDLWPKRSAKR